MTTEFQRTTQYGLTYCVGRNCRFLQGPRTNKSSVERLSQAIAAGKEHSETFLNYRRDGSPFMNLLMVAPLLDSQGRTRYFIGAQIDVSGLVKDGTALEGLQRLLARQQDSALAAEEDKLENEKDDFQRLSEVMNSHELETVRRYGGKMHEAQVDDDDDDDRVSLASGRPRLLLNDISGEELDSRTSRLPPSQAAAMRTDIAANGRLQGVYQNVWLFDVLGASRLTESVSSCSSGSHAPHSLHEPKSTHPRNSPVIAHESHWRLGTRPSRARACI